MEAGCSLCGTKVSLKPMHYACGICGGLLQIDHDYRHIDTDKLKRIFHERRAERNHLYASGVWRYKELIAPELPEAFIVTKYEGNTGLYESPAVTSYSGIRWLRMKAQSENPSGSFKDNGMTAAVSHGRYLGYDRFACTSTGNTSSSLAMYASLAGSSSLVLVPDRDISPNKVLQTVAYGAEVCSFTGTYDDGIQFLEEKAEQVGLYLCNSINPLRIEGQKSIIYEIAQDLDWKLPDWIILPGGALSNAAALGRGLQDLFSLGFITKLPQVAVVQAEGASPFHRMVAGSQRILTPEQKPYTRATALNIGNPPSWRKAVHTLELTQGTTISVSDDEIMEAKARIHRSGIGCEPASAAGVAGLRKLVRQGIIHPDQTAVCILTGSMLKDTEAIDAYHLRSNDTHNDSLSNPIRQVSLSDASWLK